MNCKIFESYNREGMSFITKYTKQEVANMKKEGIYHLTWGFGIEHEMQFFHIPSIYRDSSIKIQDFILFDSKSAIHRLLKEYENGKVELTNNEYDYIQQRLSTYETSGRKCNKKWIVKQAPYEMPEFITWKPFCSIQTKRNIGNLTEAVVESKELLIELLMREKVTKKLIEKYGPIEQYPFGMTRYMSVPKSIQKNEYKFVLNEKKRPFVRNDYTGSYHITFTLPHDEKTTEKEFILQHQNFGNQLQWLEPMMLIGFFSGDEYAVGSKEKRVRGSYRVLNIGWGNLAGSDVRLLGTKGIGRYAKTPNYWRKNLHLFETDKLKPCIPASPSAIAENGISSLSSDLRTFGNPNPEDRDYRVSGYPMNKPNGIEFRIFDQFNDKNIHLLTYFLALIAENSRTFETKGYVYQDKDWIEALHLIMKDGYKAMLNKSYIQKLRKKLKLKIKTESLMAQDVWETIYQELYEKNINGKWSKVFFGIKQGRKNINKTYMFQSSPKINMRSWIFAFMMKCNRNPPILHSFNQLSTLLNQINQEKKEMKFQEFENYVIQLMGSSWKSNVIDLLYFYDEQYLIELYKNKKGEIELFTQKEEIPIFSNFNSLLLQYCSL
jgi:hypothetical protein